MASSFVLAAALAVLTPAGPETPLAAGTRLSKGYEGALRRLDIAWLERTLTPDFTYTSVKGKTQSRQEALASMKSGFSAIKKVERADVRVVSARRAEGGLVVITDTVMVAKIDFGQKALSTIESASREEALWMPKGKTWLVKRIKLQKDSTKIDGKEVG